MKKLVLGMLVVSSSFTTMAAESNPSNTWYFGVDYLSFSFEGEGIDFEPTAASVSLGYKINGEGNWYIIPELRIGTGVNDDGISGGGASVDVDIDRFVALSVRAQYEFNNGLYFFVAPSYGYVELTTTLRLPETEFYYAYSESETSDDWESGFSAGAGYQLTSTLSAEIIAERFDETDVVSVGLNFNF